MAARGSVERVAHAVAEVEAATKPTAVLEAARRLREAAEDLEFTAVEEARQTGTTWTRIGELYGTSKQGVQQRFGGVARRRRFAEPAD
ncbi:hypothetical protein [Pseudonocardia sp. KRD291]|uniref:hypothetical protein n=1 Tax=Pseudonocardia sp. KRD291 TaxID=2792007 RepID=UPI001C4A4B13|nr:hypothetical protein [Pseudonocardia sp. KRD291]MBW0101932.1 hypothetical protein [Pseudonocardia sp. KRD291]